MQQASRTLVRNSVFGMAAHLAVKALSFGFSLWVVRTLGAEVFGQYAGVLAFGTMFAFISDLGLSAYAVREVARHRTGADGGEYVRALYADVLALRLCLSVLAAPLLIAAAWLTGRPAAIVGAIALSSLGLFLHSVQGTSDAILAGYERLDLSAAARVTNQLAFVLAGTAALWLALGYYGLIVASLLGVILMAFACWRAVRHIGVRLGRAAPRRWPALLRASSPFAIGGLALGLSYKFDSVLLSIFRGDAETGYYAAAYNLVFSVVIISNSINTALSPSLSRQAVTSPEVVPRITERALRYLLALALPIAVGASALADRLVATLYTDAYAPAGLALRIIIWVIPLMFASEFLGYLAVSQGLERRSSNAILASSGLNVALNLVLVPRYGLLAAAVMTVLTEAILVGQYAWLLRAQLSHVSCQRVLLRPALAALVMGSLLLWQRDLPLLILIALGGALYLGLMLLLGVAGPDELRILRSLRRPVPAAHSA
jgi:O-antigen/teichoic acid export membrane protein